MTPDMRRQAEHIARLAHIGQRERYGGDDYIRHVERVVALVEGDHAKAVAWLHDVIEDTDWTAGDLLKLGISSTVVDDVRVLTRVKPTSYNDYIKTVLDEGSAVARAVKLADLQDHLRGTGPELPPDLRRRYERAMRKFTNGNGNQ